MVSLHKFDIPVRILEEIGLKFTRNPPLGLPYHLTPNPTSCTFDLGQEILNVRPSYPVLALDKLCSFAALLMLNVKV
jgi:hypothetical protein